MKRMGTDIKAMLRRVMAILLAVGFLLPANASTPQDEVRAAYAAQGLICAGDEGEQHSVESHCILCLVTAYDSATSGFDVARLRRDTISLVPVHSTSDKRRTAPTFHHARAPPVLFA